MNYGFIPSVIDKENHYVFGDGFLAAGILMPDGHGWADFLPPDQFQSRGTLETYNCTAEGTLHALATLGNKLYGASFQKNLSPRYLGIMANTGTGGNNPHYVCEVLRTISGAIPDVFLPFSPSLLNIQGYYSPKPISFGLFKVGFSWLKKYNFGHDWVFLDTDTLPERQAKMKEALKYSPLAVSGYAWSLHGDGLYYSDGQPCHWFTIYDFSDGQYWYVFDSYDQTHKKLEWNYQFGQAKRYSLVKNNLGDTTSDVIPVSTLEALIPYIKYRLHL